MSPGPIRFGHQATVSSADGPGSRLGTGASNSTLSRWWSWFLSLHTVALATQRRSARATGTGARSISSAAGRSASLRLFVAVCSLNCMRGFIQNFFWKRSFWVSSNCSKAFCSKCDEGEMECDHHHGCGWKILLSADDLSEARAKTEQLDRHGGQVADDTATTECCLALSDR